MPSLSLYLCVCLESLSFQVCHCTHSSIDLYFAVSIDIYNICSIFWSKCMFLSKMEMVNVQLYPLSYFSKWSCKTKNTHTPERHLKRNHGNAQFKWTTPQFIARRLFALESRQINNTIWTVLSTMTGTT